MKSCTEKGTTRFNIKNTVNTSYRIALIPQPSINLPQKEKIALNKWFRSCNMLIASLNGVLQFQLSKAHLTVLDKQSIFPFLFNLYEKKQTKNALPSKYTPQEQNWMFPVFLKIKWNVTDFGVKIINIVKSLQELFNNCPEGVKNRELEPIARKMNAALDYGEYLTLVGTLENTLKNCVLEQVKLILNALDFKTFLLLKNQKITKAHKALIQMSQKRLELTNSTDKNVKEARLIGLTLHAVLGRDANNARMDLSIPEVV